MYSHGMLENKSGDKIIKPFKGLNILKMGDGTTKKVMVK